MMWLRARPARVLRSMDRPALGISLRLQRRFYPTEATGTTIPPGPEPHSRLRRTLAFSSLAIFAFLAGLSYFPVKAGIQIMATPVISDEETLALFEPADEFAREVDEHIKGHPLAKGLREDPTLTESRPHLKIPEAIRPRSLTAGTLAGPKRIVVPPYFWNDKQGKRMVSIFYLGSNVSGHPNIVHGGLLATLLDEGMARCCFPALPNRVAVTANLNIDYRKPVFTNSYAVLKAETVKVDGRKAWVEGRIESLPEAGEKPVVFVEAKALFIEPKFAASLPGLVVSRAT